MGVGRVDLAETAGPSHLDAEHVVGLAQSLRAGLIDAAVATSRLHHGSPLGNRHARGLLGINVLPRPHGQDRGQRVPTITRGDQHGVDVRSRFQEAGDLGVHGTVLRAVVIVDDVLDCQSLLLLQVADGDELHFRATHDPSEVVHAAMLDPNTAHDNPLARRHPAALTQCGIWDEIGRDRQGTGPAAALRNRRRERGVLSGMVILLHENWQARIEAGPTCFRAR